MSNLDLKILCVDDESEILAIYGECVTEAGFTPILCTSPIIAEQRFRDELSDIVLVVSDLQMPEKSGFQFRAAILPEALTVPFVIVSAYITKEMALEAVDLKIDGFFDKPINADEFAKFIQKHTRARLESIRESQMVEATFIEEVNVILEEIESGILALDHDRNNPEQLNLIFRGVHTIKGSSGVLSSDILTRYAHKYEDIISLLKKGQIEFTDHVYEVLLKGFDRIKELIAAATAKKLHKYLIADVIEDLVLSPPSGVPAVSASQESFKNAHSLTNGKKVKDSISVPVDILEKLSGCSGEITVIRNMVNKLVRSIAEQNPGSNDVQSLAELLEEMHKVNSTVQTLIIDLRKVPVSSLLKTVPRVFRDLGKELNKQLSLKISGEKLRVDNSLAHVLSNSLVHLMRNSADHGIEDAAIRKAANKPEAGNVSIDFREVGDEILITISDDGRGIDPDKILAKAIEKGIFPASQLAEMTPSQILEIIFAPGFSTAAKVTDVSGRGVGMDMVKTSVESVGGSISIQSVVGLGSTFTLRLPVPKSVLIITSLIVGCGDRVFALPQDSIQRVLHVDLTDSSNKVKLAYFEKTLRIDDHLYPFVSLRSVLGLDVQNDQTEPDSVSVLILKSENLEYALQVDRIYDSEEIVVKPIKSYFNPKSVFAGVTFMGDGNVGLIIDISGVAKLANLHARKGAGIASARSIQPALSSLASTERLENFLLFKLNSKAIFGVPISQVFRLEQLDPTKIKHSGAERFIVYRDSVMPVLAFDRLLNLSNTTDDQVATNSKSAALTIPTIVAKGSNGYFGFEIGSVIDIAESKSEVSSSIRDRKGVVGNAFIRDHNVTIVDLDRVLNKKISA